MSKTQTPNRLGAASSSSSASLSALPPVGSHQHQPMDAETLFKAMDRDISRKAQELLDLASVCRKEEACLVVEKIMSRFHRDVLFAAFSQWSALTKDTNNDKMIKDRNRWRMHAAANQEIDLQAWYHALFYQEVYRLRGNFWYKDAILPSYRQSYDLLDNALTPLEEAALAHVLCSPDTTYGDVAGQMYVVQAVLPQKLFQLFQILAAQGAQITKYPRSGRPAKKLFRFSFVEGTIYLTWKGKFGNQGVSMREVTAVIGGIHTDVLKWTGQANKADNYLSILCADRSIDLFFETEDERNNWRDLLKALVKKEQGTLIIDDGTPEAQEEFEKWLMYTSIGKVPNIAK